MPPPRPAKPSLDASIYSNPGSHKSAPEFRINPHPDLPPLRRSAPGGNEVYGNWSSIMQDAEDTYDTIDEGTPTSGRSVKGSDEKFVYERAQLPGESILGQSALGRSALGQSALGQSTLEDKEPVLSYDVFFDGQKVFGLDDDNFHTFVKYKDLAMIMFYDPLDPRTDEPKANFKKAAKRLDSDQFAAVDCQRYSDLCKSLDVKVMPMFRIYSMGKVLGAIRETSMFDDTSMIEHLNMLNETLVTKVKRGSNLPELPDTKKKSKCSLAKLFGFKK